MLYQPILTIKGYTPFTLQTVSPMVIGVGQNAAVLQLPFEVPMAPYARVVKCPLPCVSYRRFKMFTIFASDFMP